MEKILSRHIHISSFAEYQTVVHNLLAAGIQTERIPLGLVQSEPEATLEFGKRQRRL